MPYKRLALNAPTDAPAPEPQWHSLHEANIKRVVRLITTTGILTRLPLIGSAAYDHRSTLIREIITGRFSVPYFVPADTLIRIGIELVSKGKDTRESSNALNRAGITGFLWLSALDRLASTIAIDGMLPDSLENSARVHNFLFTGASARAKRIYDMNSTGMSHSVLKELGLHDTDPGLLSNASNNKDIQHECNGFWAQGYDIIQENGAIRNRLWSPSGHNYNHQLIVPEGPESPVLRYRIPVESPDVPGSSLLRLGLQSE